MPSLDVDSFFREGPLDESIDICVKELFKTSQIVSGLNKQYILERRSSTTKKTLFYLMNIIIAKLME